ncbi:hypothetical protein BVIET440_50008 [Burkholderia vietnamiensis]|nr:hypothetical protein BVI1335_1630013 [Burkholderia vietnamiensis]
MKIKDLSFYKEWHLLERKVLSHNSSELWMANRFTGSVGLAKESGAEETKSVPLIGVYHDTYSARQSSHLH